MGETEKKKNINHYGEQDDKGKELYLKKASVLVEALPYIKQYSNKIVVVKLGGSMMEDDSILREVLDDITLMKYVGIKVLLIHGGGKQITEQMREKGIEVKFVDGLRVTTEESIQVVQMVLLGNVNTKIVKILNKHGDAAAGINGNDGNFIECRKKIHMKDDKPVDLGLVGEIIGIDQGFLTDILDNNLIPVIASLGTDKKGNLYNINADTCASKVAASLKAEKLILLTDVDGIIDRQRGIEKLVSKLDIEGCLEMIRLNTVSEGMIPKVQACIDSLKEGVGRAHILNGTKTHSLLIEIFTDRGIGTMIVKE